MGIISARAQADSQESYTAKLLQGELDYLLKKVGEEATEVVMAAKDAQNGEGCDQLRYETIDLMYHLLVLCERMDLGSEELSAEMRGRF
jgi:phosphoribosyl-ATP pyrophosphohydrolase